MNVEAVIGVRGLWLSAYVDLNDEKVPRLPIARTVGLYVEVPGTRYPLST